MAKTAERFAKEGLGLVTQTELSKPVAVPREAAPKVVVANKYDMRRLSYAGTFTNPLKVFAIAGGRDLLVQGGCPYGHSH